MKGVSPSGGLDRTLLCSMEALTTAMAVHDPNTAGHQERVSRLARELGRRMELEPDSVALLGWAGYLHDVGKLGVPGALLQRPDELGPGETLHVRSHAVLGAQMLRHIGFPDRLCDVVKQHHERLDGSGYPEGLIAAQLSIEARVLAVADVIDAMLSRRPYRPARELHQVFDALDLGAGRLYDTRVVDVAFELLDARVDEALESTPVA